MENPWSEIGRLAAEGESLLVVTVISVRGSVPGVLGAKMALGRTGRIFGTVGGGKVEAKVITFAEELLRGDKICETVTWNLQQDVGMTCGGEMSFLFEKVGAQTDWHILIFGAGHVSQALVGVLSTMACEIDVVDERAEWLDALPENSTIKKHHVEEYSDGLSLLREGSMVMSITKGHSTDRPVIRGVFRSSHEVKFIGTIGSAAKRVVLLRELREDGIEEEKLERLVCPLGLPIGGNVPDEIAISIAAQILACRDE